MILPIESTTQREFYPRGKTPYILWLKEQIERRGCCSTIYRGGGKRKLTDDQVRAIRKLYTFDGISSKKLAAEYNITVRTIQSVVSCRYYRDVR